MQLANYITNKVYKNKEYVSLVLYSYSYTSVPFCTSFKSSFIFNTQAGGPLLLSSFWSISGRKWMEGWEKRLRR